MMEQLESLPAWLAPVIILIVLWDAIWKLIALWKSARSNQLGWFILLGVINSAGILSIVYLLLHKNRGIQE